MHSERNDKSGAWTRRSREVWILQENETWYPVASGMSLICLVTGAGIIVVLLRVMTLDMRHFWNVFFFFFISIYFIRFRSRYRIDRWLLGTDSSDKKIDNLDPESAFEWFTGNWIWVVEQMRAMKGETWIGEEKATGVF